MSLDTSDPLFHRFTLEFSQELFFEAHETMEQLWIKKGRHKGDPYQGLVQLAVAREHLKRGNLEGARRVYVKAHQKLEDISTTAWDLRFHLAESARRILT